MNNVVQAAPEAEPEWQDNTPANPFWRCQTPVEVEHRGGNVQVLKCPRCGSRMTTVTRWRKLSETKDTR